MTSPTKGPGPSGGPSSKGLEPAGDTNAVESTPPPPDEVREWLYDADTPLVGQMVSTSTGGSGSVMMRHAMAEASTTIAKVGEQVDAIVGLLATSGFDRQTIERHQRTLEHLITKRSAALMLRVRYRRTEWMERVELDGVPPSALAKNDDSTETDAMSALATIGATETPRRVVVRGGDRDLAVGYAEANNPTTTFLDLGITPDLRGVDPSQLGRTLGGQHTYLRG